MSSPEFGEPPIFLEDLRLQGEGEFVTEGIEYKIEGCSLRMRVPREKLGNPRGFMYVVLVSSAGISTAGRAEDRLPNDGWIAVPID